ncbi:hypothetical protein Aconfl_10660 [Algoriphagus confluentis]|uniref:Sulfatase N-terminal domain-containing protein n=2 Tax=Algoriphagus confluentis TaxID=1697556 RepID=A0ABQ6PKG6_9BACT|nr:hypothetical protein Aconfl_10660 [Algoriphagus confluentis]
MAQKAQIHSVLPAKLEKIMRTFWGMAWVYLLLMLILRVAELKVVFQSHVLEFDPTSLLVVSFFQDLGWVFYFLGLLLIIHLLWSLFSVTLSKILVQTILTLVLLIHIGLVFYFSKTLLPLGKDLFAYNLNDMLLTVKASGQLNALNLGLGVVFFGFVLSLLHLGVILTRLSLKTYFLITGGLLIFILLFRFSPGFELDEGNEIRKNIQLNKSKFLAEETFDYLVYGGEYYFDFYLRSGNEDLAVKKTFNRDEFPFAHQAAYPDVLSPFFDSLSSPPDLVFILAESFGKAYSGKGAYLGSFTPFLDSLENHSLTWTNAISSTGRTFGILPGIFAGLPFGEKGFLELYDEFPYHQTLISILRDNGYKARFFIGADRKFDHEGDFLEYQQVDQLEDESTFLPGFEKAPSTNGFSWGFSDKELFKNGLQKLPAEKSGPEIRIFQTQTSHDPYIVPERAFYEQKFSSHLRNYLQISPDRIPEYEAYKNIYMTVLYADDAIRMFFEEYKKRPEFSNTIFIITGDHRLPEIPMSSRLDRFHVPLLIYSPLIKSAEVFKGISSHFEVTPSILSFLEKNAGIDLPQEFIWQGQVLDTSRVFRSQIAMPLMRNKNQLVDYLSGEFFLSDGQLFLISDRLNIDQIEDSNMLNQLNGEFEDFKNKNAYTVQTRKLLPPQL